MPRSSPDQKVDFVVPSRDEANPILLRQIMQMPCAGQIINTREKPLSVAHRLQGFVASGTSDASGKDDNYAPLLTKKGLRTIRIKLMRLLIITILKQKRTDLRATLWAPSTT
jgi:hypothetical protein